MVWRVPGLIGRILPAFSLRNFPFTGLQLWQNKRSTMRTYFYLVLLLTLLFNYSQTLNANKGLSNNIDKTNADEINLLLTEILDGVGLYTILGDFKPVSTIKIKSLSNLYKIPEDAIEAKTQRELIIKKIDQLTPLLDEMSNDIFHFKFTPIQSNISIPFADYKITLMPEVLILRKDITPRVIKKHYEFFQSVNIDTSSNYILKLENFLFAQETNSKNSISINNRTKAFGYLFAYPDYAIDFFINAENKRNADNQFSVITAPLNDRRFVQIPVYGNGCKYCYAIPKDSELREEDLILINKAKRILDEYTHLREKHAQNSTFNASQFIKDWYNN